MRYVKVNKKDKICIYKVEQREKVIFKSSNSIKYYFYYFISLIFYSNLDYFLVLQIF